MKLTERTQRIFRARVLALVVFAALCMSTSAGAQNRRGGGGRGGDSSGQGDPDIQLGIDLTRQGKFAEAIRHFLAAQARVGDDFVLDFNLSLCYVATGQFKPAIALLNHVRAGGRDATEIENLLAQAYIGDGQQDRAFEAFQSAVRISPKDEKLYLYIADACMQSGNFDAGLKIVETGVNRLPKSAPLHLDRGLFFVQLDRVDDAQRDLVEAAKLAPGSDIAYIATAQADLLSGDVSGAVQAGREGIRKPHPHFMLPALFGEAVVRAGIDPQQPEFSEAVSALEKSTAERGGYSSAQLALAKLYLLENRIEDAIARLNIAGQLEPDNPAVYSNLVIAYRKRGDAAHAQEAAAMLARLNALQAQKIADAKGDTKAGYAARTPHQ
ncbi:MAG TPA: tetratricopeptide repeat protein [Candidatus Acidoferrales bacterium]|nr:tetratricopeptide repeat protein [Candidatus Acidoferrales bacterium]